MTNSNPSSTKPLRLPKTAFYFTALFAFLGFADAAYLTADHYLALPLPCTLTHGCNTVLTSQYATIGPLPIALLGALFYLAVLFLAVHLYTSDAQTIWPARAICWLSGFGAVISCALIGLQIFVIHAICMYCFFSDTLSVILFVTSCVLLSQMSRSGNENG